MAAGNAGAKRAGQRKLFHELGIVADELPLDKFHFLTRIHYKAASDGVWGEHESTPNPPSLRPIRPPLVGRAYAEPCRIPLRTMLLVDYILFIRTPVTVNVNPNEVMDYKYVTQDQLRQIIAEADGPNPSVQLTPWFRLIAQTKLFQWWDALAANQPLPSDTTIHRML